MAGEFSAVSVTRVPAKAARKLHVRDTVHPSRQVAGFEVCLPMPPSLWRLYEGTGKNRRRSRAYQPWYVAADKEINLIQKVPHLKDGPFAVTILGDFPGDIDNRAKPVLDMLHKTGRTPDDKFCVSLRMEKVEGLAGVVVQVEARG